METLQDRAGVRERGILRASVRKYPIEKISALIEQGKSEDLSRTQEESVCYLADGMCADASNSDTFNTYCWDNCRACPKYTDRRSAE